MTKIRNIKSKNYTDDPYDNGAAGAIASVATVGAAAGAAIGIAGALPGLLIGAVIGATVGAVSGLVVAEEMGHSTLIKKKKV